MFKNIIFKPHIPNCAGIGNTLKGFISGLSINENTKIEINQSYILGNFETVLDDKHILSSTDYNNFIVEPFSSWRFLILKEEEEIQQDFPNEYSDYNCVNFNNQKFIHLFTPKVTIDNNYKRELINDKVYDRFMNAIKKIKFKDIIINEINKYNFEFENTLGISVRTWKSIHEQDVNRSYDENIYKNVISDVLSNNKNINKVFLSVDNTDYLEEYIDFLKKFNVEIIIYKNPDVNYLQYVIIKMLLLSKCGYFIGNRISTFSELVFWFSECKQKVFPLM